MLGPQMPRESHLSRRAKNAAHRAANLRAEARGEASAKAHHDGLDRLAVREAQEKLPRQPVAARRVGDDFGFIGKEAADPIRDPAAERWWKIFAACEVRFPFAMQRAEERARVRR